MLYILLSECLRDFIISIYIHLLNCEKCYHIFLKILQSPPNTRIVLDFETFEIPAYTSKCEDSLEIRFSLPEHPGVK